MADDFDVELRERWIEALRSGGYAQGANYLHVRDEQGVDRYCCFGVLCEVAGIEAEATDAGPRKVFAYEHEEEWPPDDLVVRVGLTDAQKNTLVNMNDGNPAQNLPGYDFEEIAAKIAGWEPARDDSWD